MHGCIRPESLVRWGRAHRSPNITAIHPPGAGAIHRPTLRGGPVGTGLGGRQPSPQRPPDQRARGYGSCTLARAGHRFCPSTRGVASRLHAARRPLCPGRWRYPDRWGAGRVDRTLAIGDEPVGRRPGAPPVGGAPPGAGGQAAADPATDPARPGRSACRRSGAGGTVPGGGPATPDCRAGDRGDGRGRVGDPCHLTARTADPDASRVVRVTDVASDGDPAQPEAGSGAASWYSIGTSLVEAGCEDR